MEKPRRDVLDIERDRALEFLHYCNPYLLLKIARQHGVDAQTFGKIIEVRERNAIHSALRDRPPLRFGYDKSWSELVRLLRDLLVEALKDFDCAISDEVRKGKNVVAKWKKQRRPPAKVARSKAGPMPQQSRRTVVRPSPTRKG
jgi:hypothetical protein